VRTVETSSVGVRMNMDDGGLIARFQRFTTELLIEKRLGQRRPELTRELYQTRLEVGQHGLKETPEYRNVMLRADRHALWLAGLVRLTSPCPLSRDKANAHERPNAIHHGRFRPRTDCWDHVADRNDP
jgi:hypothetical protein